MKQYELETGTLMFIEVSKNFSHPFKSVDYQGEYILWPEWGNNVEIELSDNEHGQIDLPKGTFGWQPLSLFSQLKEEDVKEVMPKVILKDEPVYYQCFAYGLKGSTNALTAIHSLAQHFELDTTQPIFVIFKPKLECNCTDEQSWNCIECIKPR